MSILESKNNTPSMLNDPFSESAITSIHMHINRADGFFRKRDSFTGSILFKNGNTKGEQGFDCNSFDALIGEIKAFIQTLNKSTTHE